MMMNSGMYSSTTSEWSTPQALFDKLNDEFHFTLDPCASPENAKCKKYYTKEDDGLCKSWDGETVFMNPPYGRQIGKWAAKASGTKGVVVCLIPARTDTAWWHDYCIKYGEVRFIRGRIQFDGPTKDNAPFPSAIVIFR